MDDFKLTSEELREIDNQIDLLRGNINRMCVTYDVNEFEKMYDFAIRRVHIIFEQNLRRINAIYDNITPCYIPELKL